MRAYEQLNKGESVRLPYSRPYEDYIAWLSHQDQAAAKAFWKAYLGDIDEGTRIDFRELEIDRVGLERIEEKGLEEKSYG